MCSVAIGFMLFLGCAKPPEGAINEIRASFDVLERLNVKEKAPREWHEAQSALDEVQAEVETQSDKFALFRSYTKTKELIDHAQKVFVRAEEVARGLRAPEEPSFPLGDFNSRTMMCECTCTPKM